MIFLFLQSEGGGGRSLPYGKQIEELPKLIGNKNNK